MREDFTAQVGDDALAEGDHVIIAHGAGDGQHKGHGDQHDEIAVDEGMICLVETVVDHAAHG